MCLFIHVVSIEDIRQCQWAVLLRDARNKVEPWLHSSETALKSVSLDILLLSLPTLKDDVIVFLVC